MADDDARPEYSALTEPVNLFVDDQQTPLLVVSGMVDRFEMSDRVYLAVAPVLGVDELEQRLEREAGGVVPSLEVLAERVEWCSIRNEHDGTVVISHTSKGAPVTVCTLAGLVEAGEITAG